MNMTINTVIQARIARIKSWHQIRIPSETIQVLMCYHWLKTTRSARLKKNLSRVPSVTIPVQKSQV